MKNIHDLSCPTKNIYAFIISVCRNLLPRKSVWGNKANENKFFAFIKSYVLLGRYENKKLQYLVDVLSQHEMPWLHSVRNAKTIAKRANANANSSALNQKSDMFWKEYQEVVHLLNTNLCYMFVHWVFSSIINPVLSSMFYITEGEGGLVGSGSGSLLYYRKAVWVEITRSVGHNIISNNFVEVSCVVCGWLKLLIDLTALIL